MTATPEIYARLSTRQKDRMDDLTDAHKTVEAATIRLDGAKATFHAAVADALSAGVPALLVAERVDLSLSRVYQINALVSSYR